MKRIQVSVVVVLLLVAGVASGQETSGRDLDLYYRFPASLAARYEMVSPFGTYGSQYNVYGISGAVTVPIPSVPTIQPWIELGLTTFDSQDPVDPDAWDHASYFVTGGASYVRRLSRDFELGLTAGLGAALTSFPALIEEPVGFATLLGQIGGKVGLSPTYNLHISVEPRFIYQYGLTELDTFNGLSFSIGFSAAYRLGTDPDAPQSAFRAIEYASVDMPDLFAAMQSYYAGNPFGTVTIQNTERVPVENVTVSFYQPDLMDSPTVSMVIPELAPGEPVEVPLMAVFNSSVFELEGVTPLSGEIIVEYSYRSRPASQSSAVSYDLYDKTALTWDDNQKVAAFITPSDGALRNYQAALQRYTRPSSLMGLSDGLEAAIAAYVGLEELGIIYQADPTSPFLDAQSDTLVVDSVSLPRDTLQRFAGDCDDLTVLYCTMLESAGIETGFVTVPGHIFPVVNTGVAANRYAMLHPDRAMSINIDGELWVPVEITLLGSGNFSAAWRRGMELYSQFVPEEGDLNITALAQTVYRPVGLRQADLGLQYGDDEAIATEYSREIDRVVSAILSELDQRVTTRGSAGDYNRLGIAAAQLGYDSRAEDAFRGALRADSTFVNARINLGALQILQGRDTAAILTLQNAADQLQRVSEPSPDSLTAIYINLARAHYSLEQFDDAERYLTMASDIDPERASQYSYIAAVGADGGSARAAEVVEKPVMFAGDE